MSQRYDIFILNFFQWTLFTTAGVVNVTDTCNTCAWIIIIIINNLGKKKKKMNLLNFCAFLPVLLLSEIETNFITSYVCSWFQTTSHFLYCWWVLRDSFCAKASRAFFLTFWENNTTWWMNKGVLKLIYLQH